MSRDGFTTTALQMGATLNTSPWRGRRPGETTPGRGRRYASSVSTRTTCPTTVPTPDRASDRRLRLLNGRPTAGGRGRDLLTSLRKAPTRPWRSSPFG